MMRRTRAAALAACWAVLEPTGARAEPAPPEVDAWFEQANQRFAAGDYAAALGLLERACAQSEFPGCALNLGAVHHALRHCADAKHHYRRYLLDEPGGERVDEARAALDELDAHCHGDGEASLAPDAASAAPQAPRLAPLTSALSPLTAELAAREWPSSDAAGAPRSAALPAARTVPSANDASLPSAIGPAALGGSSPAPAALDNGPRYRAIAASVTVLGGAAALTSVYLGVRLADTNAEFQKHKGDPYDAAQEERLERAREYRALTIGSSVASVMLLSVGGVFWWLGLDDDTDIRVALDGGPELRLEGRF